MGLKLMDDKNQFVKLLNDQSEILGKTIVRKHKRILRLEKALRFYANKEHGEIARIALEGDADDYSKDDS